MNSHPLVKVAHMINRISPTIIDGEGRLVEATWEPGLLNALRKRRIGYSKEGFTHDVITLAPPWWGNIFLMIVFSS